MIKVEWIKVLLWIYFGNITFSKLDNAKWEELEYKTTWVSAEKAMDWGLMDKIE